MSDVLFSFESRPYQRQNVALCPLPVKIRGEVGTISESVFLANHLHCHSMLNISDILLRFETTARQRLLVSKIGAQFCLFLILCKKKLGDR